ncbi:hypothetical protein ABRP93_08985 [Corynebacterium sp. KPL2850]|uniref:hypothetical protein n=1 Tax=Corynebacterium TaxID=1716 RepID=UPI002542FD81|nr:hypothetical protein [Corynebacterium accolens]MDK4268491.1 hypothetical protein [Corynebacterium accolens]
MILERPSAFKYGTSVISSSRRSDAARRPFSITTKYGAKISSSSEDAMVTSLHALTTQPNEKNPHLLQTSKSKLLAKLLTIAMKGGKHR